MSALAGTSSRVRKNNFSASVIEEARLHYSGPLPPKSRARSRWRHQGWIGYGLDALKDPLRQTRQALLTTPVCCIQRRRQETGLV